VDSVILAEAAEAVEDRWVGSVAGVVQEVEEEEAATAVLPLAGALDLLRLCMPVFLCDVVCAERELGW
jgi:hypothetical protein